jgi:hypothetical protein
MIAVTETVNVVDAPALLPSAMISVTESVSVADSIDVQNTVPGSDVTVTPVDTTTGTTPVVVSFGSVVAGGVTTLSTAVSGPPLPAGFKLGTPALYFDVSTTATFAGVVTVCASYSGATFESELDLHILHFEAGAWVDRTVSVDTAAQVICAATPSLSPFVVVEREDITPPAISGLAVNPGTLWPPNHKMVDVTVSYTATDAIDPSPRCALAVTSTEPENGTGRGDRAPDWMVVDAHRVRLRAERAGKGNGRVYSIGITCSDTGGNTSIGNITVTVPKSRKKEREIQRWRRK